MTIRKLDEETEARLRVQAAHSGRSMEEEAREILRMAPARTKPCQRNLAISIEQKFARFDNFELEIRPRHPIRKQPKIER